MSEQRESTIKLGKNRNKPRVWIEGQWLEKFGFKAGKEISTSFDEGNKVVIRLAEAKCGDRTVSGRGKRPGAIIDINSDRLYEAFSQGTVNLKVVASDGMIIVTPTKTAIQKAARVLTTVAVSLFAGVGLLDEAAAAVGFETKAAVEMKPAYAEIWERNHSGSMRESSIEEVDFKALRELTGPVGLLTAGRPCEPYSTIRTIDRGGQTKRDKMLPPEAHELGHLDFYMLQAVDALNPHTVIVENVPGYLDAGSGYMVQGVLRAMGYTVDARILNSLDYGALAARERAVIVATTHDHVAWPDTVAQTLTAAAILEDVPHDSELWFGEDHWAPRHWAKQSAKGNGFAAPAITADSTRIPTLKKRYYAGQGDNFVVAHPAKPNHWRWLTLAEGRRLMGLPDSYDLGPTKTIAGEGLGQGVHVGMFQRLIASVAWLPILKGRIAA